MEKLLSDQGSLDDENYDFKADDAEGNKYELDSFSNDSGMSS